MSGTRSAKALAIEAAVIVGSILLAFGVDAWWDGVVESREERQLLVRLAAELDLFEETLIPQARDTSDRTLGAWAQLRDYVHDVREVPRDSLDRAVARISSSFQFAAATPVFDLLTSDGGYVRIGDPELSEALSNMAAFRELVRRFEQLSDEFVLREFNPWLNRSIGRWDAARGWNPRWEGEAPSAYADGYEALRSREFANLLLERRDRLTVVVRFREQFADAAARARVALEAELDATESFP